MSHKFLVFEYHLLWLQSRKEQNYFHKLVTINDHPLFLYVHYREKEKQTSKESLGSGKLTFFIAA